MLLTGGHFDILHEIERIEKIAKRLGKEVIVKLSDQGFERSLDSEPPDAVPHINGLVLLPNRFFKTLFKQKERGGNKTKENPKGKTNDKKEIKNHLSIGSDIFKLSDIKDTNLNFGLKYFEYGMTKSNHSNLAKIFVDIEKFLTQFSALDPNDGKWKTLNEDQKKKLSKCLKSLKFLFKFVVFPKHADITDSETLQAIAEFFKDKVEFGKCDKKNPYYQKLVHSVGTAGKLVRRNIGIVD